MTPDLHAILQYLADAAAVGAFVFAWLTNARLVRLETLLLEKEIGVLPTITILKTTMQATASDLAEHGVRIDQHDREIDRLHAALGQRRAAPTPHH